MFPLQITVVFSASDTCCISKLILYFSCASGVNKNELAISWDWKLNKPAGKLYVTNVSLAEPFSNSITNPAPSTPFAERKFWQGSNPITLPCLFAVQFSKDLSQLKRAIEEKNNIMISTVFMCKYH